MSTVVEDEADNGERARWMGDGLICYFILLTAIWEGIADKAKFKQWCIRSERVYGYRGKDGKEG